MTKYIDNLLKLKIESEIHKINTDEETIDNLEEITLKYYLKDLHLLVIQMINYRASFCSEDISD